MAATATDIWEFRATAGNANNGGGFDTASGGTDYSNQDSAQLALTDLATSGIGVTTLTSATGGFTAAMVGNYIQIRSGTNVTAGFYRVTVRTDTNTVTLDRAPDDGVGGISSGVGDLGGALDILTDAFLDDVDVVIAGNTIHVKDDGTMTLTGSISTTKDGTVTDPIFIEGYNTTRGDVPTGANRPVIDCGANSWFLDNYWKVKHIDFKGTSSSMVSGDLQVVYQNCKSQNTSVSANRNAFISFGGGFKLIECEAISDNGRAISLSSASQICISCNAHDSDIGINLGTYAANVIIDNCTIDTNTTAGINATTTSDVRVLGNTIYKNGTGILVTTANNWTVLNNILDANTDGAKWTTEQPSNLFDYNVWGNTTDVTNVTKGPNSVTGDPGLTDPDNGDFTVGAGSNALDAGLTVSSNVGVIGDYKMNIGVDQDDNAAGGTIIIKKIKRVM